MEEYYHNTQGRSRIVLPKQGLGKFVQIEFGKDIKDYLFICGGLAEFHSDILKRTLKKFDLDFDGKWDEDKTRFIPNAEGDLYKLIDAGRVKRKGDIIEIGDVSVDYEMIYRGDYLNKFIPHLPERIKFNYKFNIE